MVDGAALGARTAGIHADGETAVVSRTGTQKGKAAGSGGGGGGGAGGATETGVKAFAEAIAGGGVGQAQQLSGTAAHPLVGQHDRLRWCGRWQLPSGKHHQRH